MQKKTEAKKRKMTRKKKNQKKRKKKKTKRNTKKRKKKKILAQIYDSRMIKISKCKIMDF